LKLLFINFYLLKLGIFIADESLTNSYHPHDKFIFLHNTNRKDGSNERFLSNFFRVNDEGSNRCKERTKYKRMIKQSEAQAIKSKSRLLKNSDWCGVQRE